MFMDRQELGVLMEKLCVMGGFWSSMDMEERGILCRMGSA